MALELQPVRVAVSTKDDPFPSTSSTSFAPKAGLAFRRIDQDLKLAATSDNPVNGTVNYREDLDTDYWGGYIGLTGKDDMGMGWALSVDTEIGLYWADTNYKGQYAAGGFALAPGGDANVSQTLKLDDDGVAVIGALKLGLEKNFGGWTLSGFARGEIITYAPEMAYNDFDRDAVAGIRARGANDGTKIDDGTAYTVSAGARVTVPFNNASPSFGSIF